MFSRFLRVVVFAIGCGIVLWLSLAPADGLPLESLWDKAKHCSAYFVLTLAGATAFPRWIWRVAGALLVFGIGIEILQANMDLGREGDVRDALANTIGITLGVGAALLIREWIKVKSRARGE